VNLKVCLAGVSFISHSDAMFTLYILIKCLHIVAATIWFGGNFIIALLHLRAARSGDWEAVTTLGRQGGFVGAPSWRRPRAACPPVPGNVDCP